MYEPFKIVIPSPSLFVILTLSETKGKNLVVPLRTGSARNLSFIDEDCFVVPKVFGTPRNDNLKRIAQFRLRV
jgi:hypothetical protein